jgi:hypothetical protein
MQKQVDVGVSMKGLGTPLLSTVWLAQTSGWTPAAIEDNYRTVAVRNMPV